VATSSQAAVKRALTGEAPLGRQGDAWRVVHEVADARIDQVQEIFLSAFRETRDAVVLARFASALERRDVDGVMAEVSDLAMGGDLVRRLEAALAEIHAEVQVDAARRVAADVVEFLAGKAAALIAEIKQDDGEEEVARILAGVAVELPDDLRRDLEVLLSFDARLPAAERFAAEEAAALVVQVTESTRRALRADVLRAFEEGIPPRRLARQIRDRVGLTTRQAAAVRRFEAELASADPSTIRGSTRRRLDAATQDQIRALAAEGRVPAARRRALVERYRFALLNRRAENIARTETIDAATAGQDTLWDEAMEREVLDRGRTRRHWVVTPDDRLDIEICAPIPGLNPDGVKPGEPFETPVGLVPRPTVHPGCRCALALTFEPGDRVRGVS